MKGLLISGALLVAAAAQLDGQVPSASTRALGMGDNYSALARGYDAAAWNPALLGLPANPRASLAVLPVRGIAGLDPVTLGDIADYGGVVLPVDVRERWLTQIEREGSEQGTGGGDVTWLAAQVGRFALQAGTTLRAIGNLSPGAAEVLLFGNYGRAQTPRALTLDESDVHAYALTTFAASYGMPVGPQAEGSRATIGATVKYSLGHFLLYGEDRGSEFTADPQATINFPVVGSSFESFDNVTGGGFGIDVGLAIQRNAWTFGLSMQNVINTFAWNRDDLVYRSGIGEFDVTTNTADFDERPLADAPADLRARVADSKPARRVSVGVAYEASPIITLASDFHMALGDSPMTFAPKTHAGIGVEVRVLPVLPVRAGWALITGGYQIAGGLGVNLGPVDLAVSMARRDTNLGVDTITMLTLLSTTGR